MYEVFRMYSKKQNTNTNPWNETDFISKVVSFLWKESHISWNETYPRRSHKILASLEKEDFNHCKRRYQFKKERKRH